MLGICSCGAAVDNYLPEQNNANFVVKFNVFFYILFCNISKLNFRPFPFLSVSTDFSEQKLVNLVFKEKKKMCAPLKLCIICCKTLCGFLA